VVQAYAEAYSHLDADAAMRFFPTADAGLLRSSFSQLKSQRVQIENEEIKVTGSTAVVSCTWDASVLGVVGGQHRDARKTTLTLQKSGNAWVIVARR
jgi:ketosteroid isomerase-like protein